MARLRYADVQEKPEVSPSSTNDYLWPVQQWVYDDAFKPAVWIDNEPRLCVANAASPEPDVRDWVASSWHESSWSLLHGLDVIDPVPTEHIPTVWMEKVCR
jgi:hypothetical protein